ncbi:MAG: hypothetical protein DWP92_09460 [Armatimonadetes bacterium]|nr:MAG: hypothetical protein DWP92_09460 [Armatimonadota bacterium]
MKINERTLTLLATTLWLVIAGCAESESATSPGFDVSISTTPVTVTLAPTSTSTTMPTLVKAPLAGLIDRAGIPTDELAGPIAGFVVDVAWRDLQDKRGGAIGSNNAIDVAIEEVRALNSRTGQHLRIKLRVRAGIDAPDWAKELGGSPIVVSDAQDKIGGTIGEFWIDEFGTAYAELQTKLAERYDEVVEIADVAITRCTTVYAEPFIRNIAEPETVSQLISHGFDADGDLACLFDQIDAHLAWEETRSSLALNPYQAIASSGVTSVDPSTTSRVMDYCRFVLRERCVLGNNSIRWPPLSGRMEDMYAEIESFGAPITYQTAAPARVGDLAATVEWAIERGACSVELPVGYESDLTPDQLMNFTDSLSMNPGCR